MTTSHRTVRSLVPVPTQHHKAS
jgi:gag-polypeptide of LTR copia-type